jgi:hypothetical protein
LEYFKRIRLLDTLLISAVLRYIEIKRDCKFEIIFLYLVKKKKSINKYAFLIIKHKSRNERKQKSVKLKSVMKIPNTLLQKRKEGMFFF